MDIYGFVEQDERRWPASMLYVAFAIALVYMGFVLQVTNPDPVVNIPLLLIYPLTMLLPTVVLFIAGFEQQHRCRWAWYCEGVAIMLGAVIPELLQINAIWSGTLVSPLKDFLYLAGYGAGIAGAALYLTQRPGWTGNTTRLFLDSLMTGSAVFVILQIMLPNLIHRWSWTEDTVYALRFVALDAGIIFLVAIMVARYGRNGGYLLRMSFYSLLALLVADIINLWLFWQPGGLHWKFMANPFYIVHSTYLAYGAYRSRRRPPRLAVAPGVVMPLAEWVLWTKLPRLLAFVAVSVAIFFRHEVVSSLGGFLLVLALFTLREILIARDDRRVLCELHAAKERARRAEEQTKSFLDHIIHDLATPLHSLHVALRHVGGAESWLMRIHLHYNQLERLVRQLRAYQQARYQQVPLNQLGAVDLIPICFAAIDGVQDQAECKGIDVSLELAEEPVVVLADGPAIRRILENLLVNALNATPSGGTISLRVVRAAAHRLRIEVVDTGCGIPPEQQASIFLPMVRLAGHGTGLGLAICCELTHAMHGEIGVLSQEGSGSTFWIELPLYQPLGGVTAERLSAESV